MADEDHMRILHWKPEADRWEDIPYDKWMAFRGLGTPFVPLSGVTGGIHYFIVSIHDDGVAVNLIPHKYLIEPDGQIGRDNFAGLTRQEREDYQRIMVVPRYGPVTRNGSRRFTERWAG
jgi:hypothetical protein